jgi:predicted TIM-barrel fold metal-dependent hydrolase
MIIDVNAYLGHFAFRRLRHTTADSLLTLMDSRKIDRAVVSSASAITYRNPQSGNEELDGETKGHRDRLIPFGVINPSYAGWEDDLKTCHEVLGMRGLRLLPRWHNYAVSDRCCVDLIHAATERNMIISIPIRVEDPRERSWLVNIPDLPLDDLAALVKAFPKARFLLLNGLGYRNSPLGRKGSGLPDNYCIEISRLSALLENEIGFLIRELGAERMVFGTGMPFSYPDPALLKLEVLAAGHDQKENILWRNAAKWLDETPRNRP